LKPSVPLRDSRHYPVVLIGIAILGAGRLAAVISALSADPIASLIDDAKPNCGSGECITSLVPQVFALGDQRAAVEQRLAKSGYTGRDGRYHRQVTFRPDFLSTRVCDVSYAIALSFDGSDRLTGATGDPDGSCF
jgi:hypothetical protein